MSARVCRVAPPLPSVEGSRAGSRTRFQASPHRPHSHLRLVLEDTPCPEGVRTFFIKVSVAPRLPGDTAKTRQHFISTACNTMNCSRVSPRHRDGTRKAVPDERTEHFVYPRRGSVHSDPPGLGQSRCCADDPQSDAGGAAYTNLRGRKLHRGLLRHATSFATLIVRTVEHAAVWNVPISESDGPVARCVRGGLFRLSRVFCARGFEDPGVNSA